MGRKRKAPEPDAEGYLNTGIYRRRVVKPNPTAEERDASFDALWEAAGSPKPSICDWLRGYHRGLAASLRPHVLLIARDDLCKPNGMVYSLDLGDGGQGYCLKPDLPNEVREAALDAIDAINEIRVLQHNIGEGDTLAGTLARVVNAAWKLGQAQERQVVRQFEPLVAESLARKPGQRQGAETVNEAHAELRADYQPRIDACMAKGMSYTQAAVQVGGDVGVNEKTVRNHTTNPAPRNGARRRG